MYVDTYNEAGTSFNDIYKRNTVSLRKGFHHFVTIRNEHKLTIFLYKETFNDADRDELRRIWRVWNDKDTWCQTSTCIIL